MKKTFKRPDGTEEVLEGTAEEIAEYERKLNERRPEPKPEVLKGAPTPEQEKDFAKMIEEIIKKLQPSDQIVTPMYPGTPWPFRCGICMSDPCACRFFTISWNGTDTSLKALRMPIPGDGVPDQGY